METQETILKAIVAEPVTEIEFIKHEGPYNSRTRSRDADYYDTHSWRARIQVKVLNKVFEVICTSKDKQLDDEKVPEHGCTITEDLKKQFADFGVEVSLEKVAALYRAALPAQKEKCRLIQEEEHRKAYKTNWAHMVYTSAKSIAEKLGFTLKLDTEEEYIAAQTKDRLVGRNILDIFWGGSGVYYQHEDGWFESTHLGYKREHKVRRKDFGKFLEELAAGIRAKENRKKAETEVLAENHRLYDLLGEKAREVFGASNVSLHSDNLYADKSIKKLVVKVEAANCGSVSVWLSQATRMETKDLLIVISDCGLLFDAVEYVKAIGALKPV